MCSGRNRWHRVDICIWSPYCSSDTAEGVQYGIGKQGRFAIGKMWVINISWSGKKMSINLFPLWVLIFLSALRGQFFGLRYIKQLINFQLGVDITVPHSPH